MIIFVMTCISYAKWRLLVIYEHPPGLYEDITPAETQHVLKYEYGHMQG